MKLFKDKELAASTIITAIFIAAYIVFIVCLTNVITIGVYISGIIILMSLVYTLIRPLLLTRKLNVIEIIEIVFNIIPTTILIIIYLSFVDEPIRTIATAVSASFLGGFFTLFGVGLTIKYNRMAKEEDDVRKAKPHVYPSSKEIILNMTNSSTRTVTTKNWKTELKKAKDGKSAYIIKTMYLANSDLAMCVYHGLVINGKELYFDHGQVLQRNANVQIHHDIRLSATERINSISLILYDMLDNKYYTDVEFEIIKNDNDNQIEIISSYDTYLAKD